jgi:phage baseplate assembly protein gpV
MSTRESDQDDLRLLLKTQYGHVEVYCNAQTLLQNELVDSRNGRSQILYQHALQQATLDLSNSISEVQQDLRMLAACKLSDRNQQRALDAHVQRSNRVLETIYHNGGRFHSNGIPASKDSHETKTVALATLRASIAQLEKALAM